MSKIVIDRDVFAALASDTRIEILKQLDERRKTLSEMSRAIGCNKSAIHKHLSRLVEIGLIEKEESDHKWIYYSLTGRGKNILHPEKFKITLLLSSTVASVAGAIISAYFYLTERAPEHLKLTGNTNYSIDKATADTGGDMTTLYLTIIFAVASIIFLSVAIFLWKKKGSLDMVISEMKNNANADDR